VEHPESKQARDVVGQFVGAELAPFGLGALFLLTNEI
jgi:hypothetical protein